LSEGVSALIMEAEMPRLWPLKIALALAIPLPAIVVRLSGIDPGPLMSLVIFGSAVVGAAFILAWAAEAAQADISASLAVAMLALVAVLPEYAVDLFFAYRSGSNPEFSAFAAANMTGSNRLLLGFGWPLVAFVFAWGCHRSGKKDRELRMEPRRRIELGFLALAGIYSFLIPLKGSISLIDAAVLLGLFGAYLFRVSREKKTDHDFVGIPAVLAGLTRPRRPLVVGGLFVVAGVFVLMAAEPFATALIDTGTAFGLDKFLLVQWLAPLASEAPEFIVAILFALRSRGDDAMGTLLSAKVNQWTLLVGSLSVAHLIGGGGLALELDARQVEEFFLTAAQTVLGIAVLLNLRLSAREGTMLLCLFALQFPFPQTSVRIGFSVAYLAIAAVFIFRQRASLPGLGRAMLSSKCPE
jgi:cation:H+ antiporter